jgi:hypothetical protein
MREQITVTGICRQYMMVFLTHNLYFSLMKHGSIWASVSLIKTTGIGAILIRETFEVALNDQNNDVCRASTATQIVGPWFLKLYCLRA